MAGEAAASQGGGESAPDLSAYEERLGGLEKELKSSRQEAKESSDKLGKLRDVFVPREESVDPQAEYDSFLNSVLDWSLENQKQGKGSMPITTNMAVKLVEVAKAAGKSNKEIAELKAKIENLSNPDNQQDQRAFSDLDAKLSDKLEQLYGKENFSPERFGAIASEITKEIKRLKSDQPDQWSQIRRSPKYLQAMVDHFVMRGVPNHAREMLQKQELDNYDMSEKELSEALRQAQSIQDPKARGQVVKSIREELWQKKFQGQGRRARA